MLKLCCEYIRISIQELNGISESIVMAGSPYLQKVNVVKAFKHILQRCHIYGMPLSLLEAGARHHVCLQLGLLLRVQSGVAGHVWVVCQHGRANVAPNSLLHKCYLYSSYSLIFSQLSQENDTPNSLQERMGCRHDTSL